MENLNSINKIEDLLKVVSLVEDKLTTKQVELDNIKIGSIYIGKIKDAITLIRVLEKLDNFKIKVEYVEIDSFQHDTSDINFISVCITKSGYYDNILVNGHRLVTLDSAIEKLNKIFEKIKVLTNSYRSSLSRYYQELKDVKLT